MSAASLTVPRLREELKKLGLPTDGLKKVLVERLEKSRGSLTSPIKTTSRNQAPLSLENKRRTDGDDDASAKSEKLTKARKQALFPPTEEAPKKGPGEQVYVPTSLHVTVGYSTREAHPPNSPEEAALVSVESLEYFLSSSLFLTRDSDAGGICRTRGGSSKGF